jgi:hypothetical protein
MKLCLLIAATMVIGASAECANLCSGHGSCGQNDRCTCYGSWQGSDCSERTCPFGHAWADVATGANVAHNYAECSNRGECDRKSGECACNEGFSGHGCSRHACPNGCSGHGTCETLKEIAADSSKAAGGQSYLTYSGWDATKARVCKCDPRYHGHDCSVRMCPKGDDPLTKEVDITQEMTTSLQLDEVQNVTVQSVNGIPINGGEVTFTYTDLYNGVWTTRPISLPDAKTYTNNNRLNNESPSVVDSGQVANTDSLKIASGELYSESDYSLVGISTRITTSSTVSDTFVVDSLQASGITTGIIAPAASTNTLTTSTWELRGAMEAAANPWVPLKITTAHSQTTSASNTGSNAYLSAIDVTGSDGVYSHTLGAAIAGVGAGYGLRKGDWIYVGTMADDDKAQSGCLMQVAEDCTGTTLRTYHDDTIGACQTAPGSSGAAEKTSVVHTQWQPLQTRDNANAYLAVTGNAAEPKEHGVWRFNREQGVLDVTPQQAGDFNRMLHGGMWIRLFLEDIAGASYCDMQVRGVTTDTTSLQNAALQHIFVDPASVTSTGTQELCTSFEPTLVSGDSLLKALGAASQTAGPISAGTRLANGVFGDLGNLQSSSQYGQFFPTCTVSGSSNTPCTGSGLSIAFSTTAADPPVIDDVIVLTPGRGYYPGNQFQIANVRHSKPTQGEFAANSAEFTGEKHFFFTLQARTGAGASEAAGAANAQNVPWAQGAGDGLQKNGMAGIAFINNAMVFNTATAWPTTNSETIDLLPDGNAGPSATATSVTVSMQSAASVDQARYIRAGTTVHLIRDVINAATDRFVCACTVSADMAIGGATSFTCAAPPPTIAGETPISCINGLTQVSAVDYFTAAAGYSLVFFPYNSVNYVRGVTDEFNAYKFQHLQAGDSVRVSGATMGYQTTLSGNGANGAARDGVDAATYEIANIDPSSTTAGSLFFRTGSKPNGGGMHPMLPVVGHTAFDTSWNSVLFTPIPTVNSAGGSSHVWLPATAIVQPVVAAKAFAGTAAADTWAATDTTMITSAQDVKQALEELPNGVVSGVDVTMTANTVGLYAYSVTFKGNGDAGNQHEVVMNSKGCNVDGCQPRYKGVGVQSSLVVHDLVITASALTSAAASSRFTTATASGLFDPAGGEKLTFYQAFEGAMNGKSIVTRSATDTAAGVVTDGTASAVSKEPTHIVIRRFKGDTNPVDHTAYFKSETTEITRGTKESTECSGRGACDGDAGLCECYDGYTGDACEVQTVLL